VPIYKIVGLWWLWVVVDFVWVVGVGCGSLVSCGLGLFGKKINKK
jgi:hypothetical protein